MATFDFRALEPKLRLRETFRHWTTDTVRFSDTDMMGHVNNVAYGAYCETGRTTFNRVIFPNIVRGGGGLVARVAINYIGETHFPNVVHIGTGIAHIGTSSYTLGQGLFIEDRCVATAEGVLVRVDRESHRPMPLPDEMRAVFSQWLLV